MNKLEFFNILSTLCQFAVLIYCGYWVYSLEKNLLWVQPIVCILLVFNMSFIMFTLGLKGLESMSMGVTDLLMIFFFVFVVGQLVARVLKYLILRYLKVNNITDKSTLELSALVPYISNSANMGYFGFPIAMAMSSELISISFYLCLMLAMQLRFFIFVYPRLQEVNPSHANSVLYKHRYTPLCSFFFGLLINYICPTVAATQFGLFFIKLTDNFKITHVILGGVLMGVCISFVVEKYMENIKETTQLQTILFFVFLKYGFLIFWFSICTLLLLYSGYTISLTKLVCVLLIFCLPPALNSLLVLLQAEMLLKNPRLTAELTIFFCISTFVGIALSLLLLVISYFCI